MCAMLIQVSSSVYELLILRHTTKIEYYCLELTTAIKYIFFLTGLYVH